MITDQECEKALELFNSGQWLQLEGSVGRWVNDFVQSEIIVQDEKNGIVSIIDGYGRFFKYHKGHINWDKVSTIQMEG